MKTIAYIAAMTTLVITAMPAEARERDRNRNRSSDEQTTPGKTCQKMLKERGDRARTREAAVKNAFKAWEIAAKNSYGVSYAKSENAWTDPKNPVDNPNCFDDPERWVKKWECTWEARPCLR